MRIESNRSEEQSDQFNCSRSRRSLMIGGWLLMAVGTLTATRFPPDELGIVGDMLPIMKFGCLFLGALNIVIELVEWRLAKSSR